MPASWRSRRACAAAPEMHQARGLQQLFADRALRVASVLAGPNAPDGLELVLRLAADLNRAGWRVWLVDDGRIARRLGCRPLLPWRPGQPPARSLVRAGAHALIHAPGVPAGDAALTAAVAASRACDVLLFDGGRFDPDAAPLDAAGAQTLALLLGEGDAAAAYALLKGLKIQDSPARVLLLGAAAHAVSETARRFFGWAPENHDLAGDLWHIGNKRIETSSKTLTIASNSAWLVSRITQNIQAGMEYGGSGEGAEEVEQR